MPTIADPAFTGAGQKPGLEIWRIEKMQVVRQKQKECGQFYSGDSYIVLHTEQKPGFSSFSWDIHFWLGKDTSQDEAGVAAYKTVELDDSLGGAPVQHREVQDHESSKFLSYFKKGIRYLEGGVASGFRKVEEIEHEPILFQVKGKRNVRVRQVERRVSSLNKGDVFILDCGKKLFVWVGPDSNRMERIKGIEVARQIRDDLRSGKAVVNIVETTWDTDEAFFKCLGERGSIQEADTSDGDVKHEQSAHAVVKLFRISDESGELQVDEISERPLTKSLLDHKDCYILDDGVSGIFVWVGGGCTKQEKSGAMSSAVEFIKRQDYPTWTQVTQVIEKGEPPIFKQYFKVWAEERPLIPSPGTRSPTIARVEQSLFDASTLHNGGLVREDDKQLVDDDGSGAVQVWRVEDFQLVDVDQSLYGMFFGGDSYVLLYTYDKGGIDNYIIYFWQGLVSSQDERGASALLASNLDDQHCNGRALQIRVVQGKEPQHFLKIFKGNMIVFMGGRASGFKNLTENDTYDVDGTRMYQIRGTNELNTRAVQVAERASSLNSNDVFLLETPTNLFVWRGEGCSEDERAMATNVIARVTTRTIDSAIFMDEGQEPQEFWDSIGGRAEYASSAALKGATIPPRLFHCSNASGRFTVEEIVDFVQEDLIEEDVMILDTYDEVYVWIGGGANVEEKKKALETAMEYVRSDPSSRTEDTTTILQVKQGLEPTNFTGCFHAWDPDKWSQGKPYEQLVAELGRENAGVTTVRQELSKFEGRVYPLKDLQKHPPPEGVDLTQKEKYLSDSDFQKVFGVNKEIFYKLAKWRQLELKRKTKLF